MKKLIINIVIIGICILGFKLMAQENYPAEEALLWTDRALFISGEQLHFAGQIQIHEETEVLSAVVYVELISPDNQKINQMKLPLQDSYFEGHMVIPVDVLSGYYYLRAYTKWMRNGNPEDYAYLLMKIVNPYQNEVLAMNDSLLLSDPLPLFTNGMDSQTPKTYSPAQKIQADEAWKSLNLKYKTYSLIPEGSQGYVLQHKRKSSSYDKIKYDPETRGLSISGRILVNDSLSPYHKMNVHLLGEKDFTAVLCDSMGHFNVALPVAYQERELFLIAASNNKGPVVIQIDQDFCTRQTKILTPPFALEEEERSLLLKMAKNQQISSTFLEDEKPDVEQEEPLPFYGSVFKTLILDFYVPLDSMEQYFTDIPSWVVVKKKARKRYLQLVGPQAELSLYPSLLMVDWVPVDDADKVLAMNPKLVEKIEILNQGYLHGDEIYGGIIHVRTHKGDFGNLKFPESGQYLNYKFYAPPSSSPKAPYTFDNTLFWKCDIQAFEDIEIQTPQLPGSYLLMLQGINEKGALERHMQKIQVIK